MRSADSLAKGRKAASTELIISSVGILVGAIAKLRPLARMVFSGSVSGCEERFTTFFAVPWWISGVRFLWRFSNLRMWVWVVSSKVFCDWI